MYFIIVEKTDRNGSEKQEEKKVTSGEVLSPEVLHRTSPAHSPLCRGARPVRHPGPQSSSSSAQPGLAEEPLPQPVFECSDVSFFVHYLNCETSLLFSVNVRFFVCLFCFFFPPSLLGFEKE